MMTTQAVLLKSEFERTAGFLVETRPSLNLVNSSYELEIDHEPQAVRPIRVYADQVETILPGGKIQRVETYDGSMVSSDQLAPFKRRSLYDSFFAKAKPVQKNAHREAVEARLAVLREEATEEGEVFDDVSASYLTAFCDELAPDTRPAVFLLEPGTLRAVWQDRRTGKQVGLQFLADGLIQYVLLRQGRRAMLKTLGIDRPKTVRQIVDLVGLRTLWFAA